MRIRALGNAFLALMATLFCSPGWAQEAPALGAQTTVASVHNALSNPELLVSNQVLRPREGEVRVVTGAIQPGSTFISIPVAHRRTAVLQANVGEGLGILVSPRVLDAGARGFWSGEFTMGAAWTQGESAWCFADENRSRTLCFIPRINRTAPASWSAPNPYLAQQLTIAPNVRDHWAAPLAIEQRIAVREDLRLEYVFRGWRGQSASIEIQLGGRRLSEQRLRADASVLIGLQTAVGGVHIGRSAGSRFADVTLTQIGVRSLTARRMLRIPERDIRPVPIVRAVSSVSSESAPRQLAPGDVLFEQTISPGQALGLSQPPPNVDPRSLRATGPLAPFRMNGRPLACSIDRRQGEPAFYRLPNGRRATKQWEYCIEDGDVQAGYESIRGYLGFNDGENIAVYWVSSPSPLEAPITPEPRMDYEWPTETIRVRYVGGDAERRYGDVIRPSIAVFGAAMGTNNHLQPDWFLLPVPLDANGTGVLRLGGRDIARVEGVTLEGEARIQLLAGLPDVDTPLLEFDDFAR